MPDKPDDRDHDDHDDPPERCRTCRGHGWVMYGVDLDVDDGVNGPFEGDVEKCPNCLGSGLAKDCWYW